MSPTRGHHRTFTDDELIEMMQGVEPHDFDRIAPPAQVWNNIVAELEVAMASQEADARRVSHIGRFTPGKLVLAAAAALLVVVGIAAAITLPGGDDAPIEQQLATAVLSDETLDLRTDETAQASVVCDQGENGACYIDVELTSLALGLDDDNADLELWVINGDVSDMHSLGLVTSNRGRFELPAGVGVSDDEFPIIDISIEPRDGVETHSGMSVLRGVFEQA